MSGWCFVHAADLHLDTPFQGIGRVDADLAATLRDASLDAFDRLIDLTLRREAAFLVLAGDLYDGAERGLRAQSRVHAGLTRLSEAGIATFVVHGNHDPLAEGWSAIDSWPPHVTVFGAEEVGSVVVDGPDGTVRAVVSGVSYAAAAEERNLAQTFTRPDVDALHIGVLHTMVGDREGHGRYAPCSVADLRSGAVDYWALGHVHAREVVLDGTGGDPWAVYPGNLQGRSPKPSELGAKGASVVHVEGDRVTSVEHVDCDRVRFAAVEARIDGADLAQLRVELATQAREAAAAAGDRTVLVRGVVTGRGALHAHLNRPTTEDDGLLGSLRDAAPSQVVWTRCQVRTAPELTPAELAARDDAVGEIAITAAGHDADPAGLVAAAERIADRAASTGWAAPDPTELLARARDLALAAIDESAGG